jgi:hypothetical protein
MNCTFRVVENGELFVAECSRCGARVNVASPRPPIAICPAGPGLGDRVASALSAVGITKERVSALAGGDCGCKKRQEALNDLGRKIGLG